MQSDTSPKHTNRLADEKSPYLLQHAHNPVDWYPWGEEAFAKARAEDKPIFLSIGYSTCHWCHVMERESFENEQVGAFLNEHFVSIKLDREERPDVDRIYMTAVQAMQQGGGWPLNVFLTPELKPFYGGTYWPPAPAHGRPAFIQLVQRIAEVWQQQRADLARTAEELSGQLANMTAQEPVANLALNAAVLKNAAIAFKGEFERRYGGFGRAPKFPRPCQPAYLLRHGRRYDDQDAVSMVTYTCKRMAAGGMYDQIGGGFARYSVDEKWLVPHFEKMLYDNAQLIHLYLDAWLVTGQEQHAETVRDVIRYVLRDMTHPEGGFYSAEDADSEGQEGKFYCWTKPDVEALLTPEEATVAIRYFGITAHGNFVDHSHPDPLPDLNVLSIVDPKLTEDEAKLLASAKSKLFTEREKRIRPHLDDKILASWNGLMLGAIARASVVLNDAEFRSAAEKNLAFLKAKLWDAESKTLYHRWRDGERDEAQLQTAYAYLLSGVIDLYEATLDPAHLEFAIDLAEGLIQRFYDPEDGGFYQSIESPHLIIRPKDDYDGAEPSGNSVAILSLLKLAAITGKVDYREIAEKSLKLFGDRMQRFPHAIPLMLLGLDFSLEEPKRALIPGDPNSPEVRELLHAVHATYQPNKVVLGNCGPVEEFSRELKHEGPAKVYLCTGTECQQPTADFTKIKEMLEG